jgi:hypothetical protein
MTGRLGSGRAYAAAKASGVPLAGFVRRGLAASTTAAPQAAGPTPAAAASRAAIPNGGPAPAFCAWARLP